jgi:hypothetical protein
MAALAVAKPPLRGLRQGSAQWLRPELRVRVKHLKAKGVLRHATVKQLITDSPPRLEPEICRPPRIKGAMRLLVERCSHFSKPHAGEPHAMRDRARCKAHANELHRHR